jgi:hypothetical protein
MLDFCDLSSAELLTLGRRALELCVSRFGEIADRADPGDEPVRELLRKMSLEEDLQASSVEELENRFPRASRPEAGMGLIRTYLTSLSKRFGEGPLHRDNAMFLAESLEEEASRLYGVLARHAREADVRRLFQDLSERERTNLRYLREVVLQG